MPFFQEPDARASCTAPIPLFEAAAQATRCCGSMDFWPAFFRLLHTHLAFENALVAWYFPRQAPMVVTEFDWVAPGAESPVPRYLQGMYRLDPFFQAFENGLGPGLHRLSDVAPDRFRQTDYYANYFREAVGQDEFQLVCPADGSLLSVSLGSSQHYPAAATHVLRPMLPWLIAILERHTSGCHPWGETKPSSAPAHATPFRDTLERFGQQLLSPREAEVARLILQGHSLQSMANRLHISSETVKSHRRHVYAKLDVRSPSELFSLFTAELGSAVSGPC